MAQTTVIDRLVTVLGWDYDDRGLKQFDQGARNVQKRLKSVSDMTRSASTKLGLWGVGIGAGLGGAVRAFTETETEMAKIVGLVGATGDQMDLYYEEIRRLSDMLGVPQVDLAKSLFFITSAGFKEGAAVDLLEQVTRASVAGLGSPDELSDLVTGVLEYFPHMSPQQALDQLIATVREGKLDPEALAQPLSGIMPLLTPLDIEFGEVGGAMAAMSRGNIAPAQGAIALRSVLSKLIRPTAGAINVLADLGYTMDDLKDKFANDGIMGGMAMIQEITGGDIKLLSKIFEDITGLIAVLKLTDSKMDETNRIVDAVSNASGELEVAFDTVTGTGAYEVKTSWIQFKNTIQELGGMMTPFVVKIAKGAKVLIAWYNGLNPKWKELAANILPKLALGLLGAAVALRAVSVATGLASALIGPLRWLMLGLGKTTLGTAVGVKVLAAAQWLLNTAFLGFPIIGWIAALVAAGVAVYVFRDKIIGFLRTAWTWIKETFWKIEKYWAPLATVLAGPVAVAAVLVWQHWDKITGFFTAVKDWITAAWASLLDMLLAPFRGLWDFLSDIDLFDMGRRMLMTFTDGVKSAAGGLLDGVKGVFGKVRDLLPFSDAKEGPLRHLTRSGRELVRTFAAGVEREAPDLAHLFSDTLAIPPGLLAPLPVAPAAEPAAAGGGGPRSLTFEFRVDRIEVTADGGDPKLIAEQVGEALRDEARAVVEEFDSAG